MRRDKIVGLLIALPLVAGIAYGGWHLKRWFNWSYGYEAQVQESVRKMVKPECLR